MRRPIRVAIGAGAATLALAGITGGVVLVGRAGAPSPSPTPVIRVAGVDVSSHNRQIPWGAAVGSTLGVKPLIYTNADFWMTHMGNTTSFADAGYGLFVASWGTAEPVLPAFDWGGHGWTMWQTTSCGKVPGIPGCLDRDVFNGAILSSITIP